ncbi:MAG: glyoxalase [Acidimicrobiia bacterium]|nr:MAG: glyoxalase [Acidimicrobiia bacterium]
MPPALHVVLAESVAYVVVAACRGAHQTPRMSTRGFISHLDLNVSEPEASLAFYGLVLEYLGFERHDIGEDRAGWSLRYADGSVLGIEIRPPAEQSTRRRHERYSPGIDHLAFHAGSRDDVDGLYARLLAAGHAVADPPAEYDYSPGYYAVAFDDPSGIRLEVVHDPATNP